MKAYRDGKVVAEFMGAQPGPQVERFLDALVPSEAEELVRAGGEAELRRALELEPGRADAAVPLARLLAARGERARRWSCWPTSPARSPPRGSRRACASRPTPELQAAFAALDDGELEQGLDWLIGAIPATQDPDRATTCAAPSSACWTSSGSSTRWRANPPAQARAALY